MTREYLVSVNIEGIGGTTSYITVTNGKVMQEPVVEEFYALLRKCEKSLIKDAAEQEKSDVVDTLKPADEAKLKEAHMAQYHGTDDDAPDDYENWLEDLDVHELKKIINWAEL